jgi:molecular chaperone DnaK
MTRLIDANTTIPTKRAEIFSTAADSQPSVEIHVLQGERPMAIDNKTIGRFVLDGIPPAPRGLPQIEVTFDIDANGILSVSAKDKATGREQSIKIQHSSGLSKDEIERMKTDAKSHESEDKRRREEVDLRNHADAQVFQTERQMKELEGKLSPDDKAKLQAAVDRIKAALKGSDMNEIRSSTEALVQVWNTVSTKLYEQQRAQPGPQPGPEPGPEPASETTGEGGKKGSGNVENADYEVVDDDKK